MSKGISVTDSCIKDGTLVLILTFKKQFENQTYSQMAQNQAAAQAAMKRVKVIDKYELIYIFIKLDTFRILRKERKG